MLGSSVPWCEQARASRQHLLFTVWENEERRNSQEGALSDSDCLKGNRREDVPPNQFSTFLFLFDIQEANICITISRTISSITWMGCFCNTLLHAQRAQ